MIRFFEHASLIVGLLALPMRLMRFRQPKK
jgi:hypothetical protein